MRLLFLSFAFMVGPTLGVAAEPGPSSLPRPITPVLTGSTPSTPHDQAHHLKAAADHLAKAGRQAEADQLLEQARAVESKQLEALLARKEKELDAIRAEVEKLRSRSRRQAIAVSVNLLEISASNSHLIERCFETADEQDNFIKLVQKPEDVEVTIDTLLKAELIKGISRPKVAALSGAPILFESGAEVPIHTVDSHGRPKLTNFHVGTRVVAKATMLANGKVRLDFSARVSSQNDGDGQESGSDEKSSFTIRDVDSTTLEVELDRVYMLRGLRERHVHAQPAPMPQEEKDSGSVTILLVSTQRLENPKVTQAPRSLR